MEADTQHAIRDLRLAKKTFNVISGALIDQLLNLFKDNGTLKFIKEELVRFSKDPKNCHVPAVKYFQTMNIPTKIKPVADDEQRSVVVGELIIRKDPVIFTDDVGVKIPELEALGMKEKWPRLSAANQEMVWDYIIRMAKTCAQVVIGMQMIDGRLPNMMQSLAEKGISAHPGMSEKEFAHFADQVKSACLETKEQ